MALPLIVQVPQQKPASSHLPSRIHSQYRANFAAVLKELPAGVEAMRRARIRRAANPRPIFILDWDDTCCATSFLERCGFMADLDTNIDRYAPELSKHLRVLETRVLSLLKTAVTLGTVLIITNAGDGWVELSSSRFLPAVRAFLETNYNLIKIVSARARYVDVYRQHPLQWKSLTFCDELRPIFRRRHLRPEPLHVVVLGDSIGDQYAAHAAAETLTSAGMHVVLKVVKFLERPNIDQLCTELGVLLDHIQSMAEHEDSFDVSMYKESPSTPPQSRVLHAQSRPHPQPSPMHISTEHRPTPRSLSAPASPPDSNHASLSPLSAMPTCAAAV